MRLHLLYRKRLALHFWWPAWLGTRDEPSLLEPMPLAAGMSWPEYSRLGAND